MFSSMYFNLRELFSFPNLFWFNEFKKIYPMNFYFRTPPPPPPPPPNIFFIILQLIMIFAAIYFSSNTTYVTNFHYFTTRFIGCNLT